MIVEVFKNSLNKFSFNTIKININPKTPIKISQ